MPRPGPVLYAITCHCPPSLTAPPESLGHAGVTIPKVHVTVVPAALMPVLFSLSVEEQTLDMANAPQASLT